MKRSIVTWTLALVLPRLTTATRHSGLLVAVCISASLASGCATKPASAEEELAVWLSESSRTLDVKPAGPLPAPRVRERDHKAGQRVVAGLAGAGTGALTSLAAGCVGGPLGCVVGVLFAPVGAVVGGVAGAVSLKSVDVYHDISAAKGAPELFTAVTSEKIAAEFARAVAGQSKGRRHGLRLPAAVQSSGDGELRVSFRSIDLAGATGEDPVVYLVVEVAAELASADVVAYRWGEFHYEGSAYRISEWSAAEAAFFRAELARAMDAIARQLVERLHAAPPSGAEARAREARRIRADTRAAAQR